VAVFADRLQILVVVSAASCLRNHVVDGCPRRHASGLQARLTKATVAAQDAQPDPFPSASISSRVAIAADGIRLPLDGLVRMLVAVRLASSDEYTTPTVLAWPHRANRHMATSARIERVNEKARSMRQRAKKSLGYNLARSVQRAISCVWKSKNERSETGDPTAAA